MKYPIWRHRSCSIHWCSSSGEELAGHCHWGCCGCLRICLLANSYLYCRYSLPQYSGIQQDFALVADWSLVFSSSLSLFFPPRHNARPSWQQLECVQFCLTKAVPDAETTLKRTALYMGSVQRTRRIGRRRKRGGEKAGMFSQSEQRPHISTHVKGSQYCWY